MTDLTYSQDWADLNKYRAANAALPTPGPGERRVVFMGNSITEAWPQYDPEFFANRAFINRGISGQTTSQMLLRFRPDVIDLQPALVIILGGTNDIAGNTGPITQEMISANIQSMVQLARANEIEVIVCSVLPASIYDWNPGPDPSTAIPALNTLLESFCSKNNITYLDLFTHMVNDSFGMKKEYTYDGVHPNAAGYEVMSKFVGLSIHEVLTTD